MTQYISITNNIVPGFERKQWASLSSPRISVPDAQTWRALNLQDKITLENQTVDNYLNSKSTQYQNLLKELAARIRPMHSEQAIAIVIPAYNEQDNIENTLQLLANQSTGKSATINPGVWGVTIVVNRPVTNDTKRNENDQVALQATVSKIEAFQRLYPQLDINYIAIEVPIEKAGVGLARMLGHDLTALRSRLRPAAERMYPLYIQTMDADTSGLRSDHLALVQQYLERDQFSNDLYRQIVTFPKADLLKYPLLHAMDTLWTGTIRSASRLTDSPWTAGAGILVGLYAHCTAGGVFPFRFKKGVDEDIRIGIHARSIRLDHNRIALGEIEQPLFETDTRRYVAVIGHMLAVMNQSGLSHSRGTLTRELMYIARTLQSYIDFNDTLIRGKGSPAYESPVWLEDRTEFCKAVPTVALEVMINSFRELLRTEISIDLARKQIPFASAVYQLFARGDLAYCIMSEVYNRLETKVYHDSLSKMSQTDRATFKTILNYAHQQASKATCNFLENCGITTEIVDTHVLPLGSRKSDPVPWPIRVKSLAGYQQFLRSYLLEV